MKTFIAALILLLAAGSSAVNADDVVFYQARSPSDVKVLGVAPGAGGRGFGESIRTSSNLGRGYGESVRIQTVPQIPQPLVYGGGGVSYPGSRGFGGSAKTQLPSYGFNPGSFSGFSLPGTRGLGGSWKTQYGGFRGSVKSR